MTLKQKLQRYRDYFGCDKHFSQFNGAQMTLQNRGNPVSSYLNLSGKDIKTPLSDDEVPRYACNHPHDLLDSIRKNDNHVYLNEALLSTWPSDKVVQLFKSTCKKALPDKLQHVTFDQLYSRSKHSGKLIDYSTFGPDGDSLIAFVVPYLMQDGSDEIVKIITDALYVSGYILSFSEDVELTDQMKDLGIGVCLMQFEARYSRKAVNFSKFLYHVSPSRYFEKIVKHGLVPKSQSSFYKYPDRVYLFNQSSINFVKDFGVVKQIQLLDRAQNQWVDDSTFVVFSIDRKKMLDHPLYKNGKMVFYVDPCYDGRMGGIRVCEAIYTYSHIPLELLEKKCFVYVLDNDKRHMTAKLNSLKDIR